MRDPDARIDVTRDLCPMTFVKTKLELEELAPGQLLEVLVRDGEPVSNVSRSVQEEGNRIVHRERQGDTAWRLLVERGGGV